MEAGRNGEVFLLILLRFIRGIWRFVSEIPAIVMAIITPDIKYDNHARITNDKILILSHACAGKSYFINKHSESLPTFTLPEHQELQMNLKQRNARAGSISGYLIIEHEYSEIKSKMYEGKLCLVNCISEEQVRLINCGY